MPATSKIDFSIILPKMSSRRLKQLFFNGISWINDCISYSILCLEMWHLKLLFLTMHLCIWVLLATTLKILFMDMECIGAITAIFWIKIWTKKLLYEKVHADIWFKILSSQMWHVPEDRSSLSPLLFVFSAIVSIEDFVFHYLNKETT